MDGTLQRSRYLPISALMSILIVPASVVEGQVVDAVIAREIVETPDELFLLAAGYYEREQWAEAIQALNRFLETGPQSPNGQLAIFYLGEAYLKTGQTAYARSAFQRFILAGPQHPLSERAVFRVSEIAYRENDKQSTRLIEAFLSAYPNSDWRDFAWLFLGNRRLAESQFKTAQSVFERGLREFPESPLAEEMRFGLATSLHQLGETAEAHRFWKILEQSDNRALANKATLRTAAMSIDGGDVQSAFDALQGLLLQPLAEDIESEVHYQLARIWFQRSDFEQARVQLDLATRLPMSEKLKAVVLHDRAVVAFQLNNPDEAASFAQRVIQECSDSVLAPSAFTLQQQMALDGRHYKQVIEACSNENVPASWRSSPQVAEILGRALYADNQFQQASATFQRLLNDSATSEPHLTPTWRYLLAISQIGDGRFEAALGTLDQIDKGTGDRKLDASIQKGILVARLSLKNWPEVERESRTLLEDFELEPENREEVLSAFLNSLAEQSKFDELSAWLTENENASLSSSLVTLLLTSANRAFAEERLESAAHLYTRVIGIADDRSAIARALAGIGWIAKSKGELPKAKMYFLQVIDNYPEHPVTHDVLLELAGISESAGAWQDAARYYGQAISSAADEAVSQIAQYKQAIAWRKSGTPFELNAAKRQLETLAKLELRSLPKEYVWYELVWIAQAQGDASRADQLLKAICVDYPSSLVWPDAALRYCQSCVNHGDAATAIPLLDKLKLPGANTEIQLRAYFLAGQLASDQGDWGQAYQQMQFVSQAEPNSNLGLKASYWLGESAYRLGKFEEAIQILASLSRGDNFPDAKLAPWIELRLGQSHGQIGQWREAAEIAERAPKKYPNFELAYEFEFLNARALFSRGELGKSIESFEKVINSPAGKQSETAAQAQWRIGEALFLQERFADAIKAYYRVDSLYEFPQWRAAAILQAGKCQEKLKNFKQATILYSNLIKRFPDTDYASQARKRLSALDRQVTNPNSQVLR